MEFQAFLEAVLLMFVDWLVISHLLILFRNKVLNDSWFNGLTKQSNLCLYIFVNIFAYIYLSFSVH